MPLLATIQGPLAPWLIAGAIAAILPLAAHLRAKRPTLRIAFPAARFLAPTPTLASRLRTLKSPTLLTLRILALTLIALAFARPAWLDRQPLPTTGQGPVLIIDASASMQRLHHGRPLFDIAIERALNDLNNTDPTQPVGVILAGRQPSPLLPRRSLNHDALKAALAQAQPTLESADLDAAIALANNMPSPTGEPPATIHLYTDGNSITFSPVQRTTIPAPSHAPAITALYADQTFDTTGPITLSALLNRAAELGTLRLDLYDTRTKDLIPIYTTRATSDATLITFTIPPHPPGLYAAKLSAPASQSLGNQHWTLLQWPTPPTALLVTTNPAHPIAAALDGATNLATTTPDQLTQQLIQQLNTLPRLIVLNLTADLPPDALTALEEAHAAGAAILSLLPNQQLVDARLTPIAALGRDQPAARLTVGPLQPTPRWPSLNATLLDAWATLKSPVLEVSPAPGAITILTTTDTAAAGPSPALLLASDQRTAAFLIPTDTTTRLARSPLFPLLIRDLVTALAPPAVLPPDLQIGAPAPRPTTEGLLFTDAGDPHPATLPLASPAAPGLARLWTDLGEPALSRVWNINDSELADLDATPRLPLLDKENPPSEPVEAVFTAPADPLPLWPALLIAALAALALEAALTRRWSTLELAEGVQP